MSFALPFYSTPSLLQFQSLKRKKKEKIGQIENKVTFIEIAIRTKIV